MSDYCPHGVGIKYPCFQCYSVQDRLRADNAAKDARIEHEEAQTKIVLDSYAEENQRLHDMLDAKDARIAELKERCRIRDDDLERTVLFSNETSSLLIGAKAEISELKVWGNQLAVDREDIQARAEKAEAILPTLAANNETLRKRIGKLEALHEQQVLVAANYAARAEKAEADCKRAEAIIVEMSDKGCLMALRDGADRAEQAEAKVASGLSWGGFNLFGDSKSIDEAKRLLHEAGRAEQLVVLIKDERARAEKAEAACKRAEAERDAAKSHVVDLEEIVKGVHFLRKKSEAERDALHLFSGAQAAVIKEMREALMEFVTWWSLIPKRFYTPKQIDQWLGQLGEATLNKARAALAPSPAGREG